MNNILFIMCDQLRHDWLSYAGASWCPTPHIDSLAASGTVFNQCVTGSPLCLPARIGLATGLRPHRLGAMDNRGSIPAWAPCYYRHFRSHGYRTVLQGKAHLDAVESLRGDIQLDHLRPYLQEVGFDEGCEIEGKAIPPRIPKARSPYSAHLHRRGLLQAYCENITKRQQQPPWTDHLAHQSVLPAEDHIDRFVADTAIQWLQNVKKAGPWYIHLSFSGPHCPYDPPAQWAEQFADARMPAAVPYSAERSNTWLHNDKQQPFNFSEQDILSYRRYYSALVAHIDAQIGRVLETLDHQGLRHNTVIVFTSDHGDDLGDYDHVAKFVPMEKSIRVPLLISGPGVASGKQSNALCELHDAHTTINNLVGLPRLDGSTGHDLFAQPDGRSNQCICCKEFRLIRNQRYKYVEAVRGPHYLFDLQNDPHESSNIIDQDRSTAKELREQLHLALSA